MIKVKSEILTIIIGLACLTGLWSVSTFAGDSADWPVTVTVIELDHIVLAPVNPSVTKSSGAGPTLQFTATAVYSDSSTAVVTGSANWTSLNMVVATIGSNTGEATILAVGTTTISATYGDKPASTTLTVIEAATTPPPSGGGGGGGGAIGEKKITSLVGSITQSSRIMEDIEAQSADYNANLLIKKGTVAQNRNGLPLTSISVEKLTTPLEKSPNIEVIGHAYDITPNGSRFEPSVPLTIKYNKKSLPIGIMEKNLYIARWDAENNGWEKVLSAVDTDNNMITANINHLSIYTIIAGTSPAKFVLSQMTLNPVEVDAGKSLSIQALITNSGDLAGSYGVALKINNVVVETRNINLASQASQSVSFTINTSTSGRYVASIDTLSATFTVKAATTTVPPTTAVTSIVSSATTPATITKLPPISAAVSTTATAVPPTPVGALPVIPPKDNWTPILFSILGGAAIILVFLILRQRRR